MSFKIKFRDKYLEFKLDKAIKNKSLYNDLSVFMQNRIYQNTKRGYYGGIRKNLSKFKPLSDGYIKSRQSALRGTAKATKLTGSTARKAALKKFGDFFSPKRSNLTYSGEMLDALDSKVSTNKQTVGVFVKDTGRSDDSGLTNREVAKKVNEARPFPTIDTKGINTMVRLIIASMRRSLRGR